MQVTNLCSRFGYEPWMNSVIGRLYDAPYNVIVYTYQQAGYVFDEAVARCLEGSPLVVFDFSEEGPETSWKTTAVLGHAETLPAWHLNSEYARLNDWLSTQHIVAYFKREYSSQLNQAKEAMDLDFPIYPVELLADTPQAALNKDEWMGRLGGVFHLYGYSHMDRKRLHGALQCDGITTIVNSLQYVSACHQRGMPFHLLEEIPFQFRYPMGQVYEAQAHCALSVALPGAGVKCWRNMESCVGTVPVVSDLGTVWTVPWTNENALLLPTQDGCLMIEESVRVIREALQDRDALFARAQGAAEAARQYHPNNYVDAFINKRIKEQLYPRRSPMDPTVEDLIDHVERSLASAMNLTSRMTPCVLEIRGFSTPTMRHLFNNLCSKDGMNYLEIGAYCGGTACAAMSNNFGLNSYIVDDFSQPFGVFDPWAELLQNLDSHNPGGDKQHFFNRDCFTLGKAEIPSQIDVFFYDGNHDEEFQARALPYFIDYMSKIFIHLVDDYNWESVRKGTAKALKELEGRVVVEKQWVFETQQDDPIWHNGLMIAVMRKI